MFVYILFSDTRSRYYVGQTSDIVKRLEKHNHSGVPSTKGGVPWKLIKVIEVEDRSAALLLEKKIKKRGAGRYLKDNQFGV
ncbi:MAG: GIY-YIG nuclease family protein [Lutibacter sp.]|nr:GIY-YIG nuclease family protein [Lutibacter sp.]